MVLSDCTPGSYRLTIGIDTNSDTRMDTVVSIREIDVNGRRAKIPLELRPGREMIIEVDRTETGRSPIVSVLPDLAVTRDQLKFALDPSHTLRVTLPVHNIGSAGAGAASFLLLYGELGEAPVVAAKGALPALAPPLDLEPKIHTITCSVPDARPGRYVLIVDNEEAIREFNETNNVLEFRLTDLSVRAEFPSPADVAIRVADKVIRETTFEFTVRPQQFKGAVLPVDFGAYATPDGRGLLYARATATCSVDSVVRLGVSHTGPLRVWCNSTEVYRKSEGNGTYREYAYDMYRFPATVPITLRSGDNQIVLETANGDTASRAALALLGPDDMPVTYAGFTQISTGSSGVRCEYAGPVGSGEVDPREFTGSRLGTPSTTPLVWRPPVVRNVKRDIIPEGASFTSHSYFEWHYANGQMALAILGLADMTQSAVIRGWVDRYCATTLTTLDEFRHQYDVLQERTGYNYRIFRGAMLDDTSAPALPFVELLLRGMVPESRPLIDTMAQFVLHGQARLPDGTFCRPEPKPGTVWADDLFMSVPFLLRYGELTGDGRCLDDAAAQVEGIYARLFDPASGLASHAWFEKDASAFRGPMGKSEWMDDLGCK